MPFAARPAPRGTDLYFGYGPMTGTRQRTTLEHEAVATVAEVGSGPRKVRSGDRMPATRAVGGVRTAAAGCAARYDTATPDGPTAATARVRTG